jgi:hypothetical protein
MKACPLPEAANALVKLREIDPEAVRRAATLAGLAGLTTAAEENTTADPPKSPIQVADVVADDATTNSARVVSTGSQPLADSKVIDMPNLAPENKQSRPALIRWFFWLVLVVIVAFLSRYLLQSGKSEASG